jgi:ABC-type lipoprotein release transport system permease subunit
MNYKSISVGIFLAIRQIRRANIWTNILIVFVMTLTFLNLVVVGGILVGLIEASVESNRTHYSSDIFLSNLLEKTYIEGSTKIIKFSEGLPEVSAVTARYVESGRLEAGYKERTRQGDILDNASGLVTGIDPVRENEVTALASKVVEGEYLEAGDEDQILIGGNLLFKYSPIDSPGLRNLKLADLGSRVRLVVNGNTKEVTIKGIIKSKVGELDQRIFINDRVLRGMIGRTDYNVDEIAIKLKDSAYVNQVKQILVDEGFGAQSKIRTWNEAQPKFLVDIKDAFALLGDIIGSVGLVVASITIFIVIFVNAITRRKYIGILKGVGIDSFAIEVAYIIQSLFYALAGTLIGVLVLYFVLVPFIDAHPINFPFSDGILVATASGTLWRAFALLVATVIAGYIPAKIVSRQNTLDAILGR